MLELLLQVLLTDTVGFIQKLPTQLVAAFRATLEEITEASLLLHVVDVSHPNAAAQTQAVMQVLLSLPDMLSAAIYHVLDTICGRPAQSSWTTQLQSLRTWPEGHCPPFLFRGGAPRHAHIPLMCCILP